MRYNRHFTSLQAMQRYIETTPKTWGANSSHKDRAEHSWDLGAGYEGALKYAREGWREGGKAFATGLATLPAQDVEPDLAHSVAGFSPDVARFAVGLPDCMYAPTEHALIAEKPILTLAVNVCANASANAGAMSRYGMAIAHYVDELENSGLQVELIAAIPACVSGVDVCNSWTVKAADERMNLETVAFSIGHPACFRRLGFAVHERLPSTIREDWSYGQAATLKAEDLPGFPDALLLNGMKYANSYGKTPAEAYKAVAEEIEAARKVALGE